MRRVDAFLLQLIDDVLAHGVISHLQSDEKVAVTFHRRVILLLSFAAPHKKLEV